MTRAKAGAPRERTLALGQNDRWRDGRVVECIRLESEQTVKGLGSSNLPLSSTALARRAVHLLALGATVFAGLTCLATVPVSAGTQSTISGRIVRTDTHATIGDATVTVLVRSGDRFVNVIPDLRTRNDGSFSALGIEESDVIVSITAKDYDPLACRYHLSPGGLVHGDFTLKRTRAIAPSSASNATCPSAPSDGGHTQTVYDVR